MSSGKHLLQVFFKIPESEAEIILKSVSLEIETSPSKRSSASLRLVEGGLLLKIEAEDLTALRAAANSFLRFIDAAVEVLRLTRESF